MQSNKHTLMWDELRKEARKVEAEVDHRLAAYSRLGSSVGLSSNVTDSTDPVEEAELRASEIERLLEQLKVIHGAMTECTRGSSSDLLSHTLARHNDILHEYTQEFVRTRKNVTTTLKHAQLVGPASQSKNSKSAADAAVSAQQSLWRERGAIQSATSQADEVIAQAQATSDSLQQQRGTFEGVYGKVTDVSQKFPLVNNLLSAIKRKKSKDTIILTAVVMICSVLLLLYWLNK